jgi:hypothetical protein
VPLGDPKDLISAGLEIGERRRMLQSAHALHLPLAAHVRLRIDSFPHLTVESP